ncbi:MAG TPA: TasA family protein [Thermoleophilaceae bacterium]|nr:TasA family protein [Thermoleophilaceae bacterium]
MQTQTQTKTRKLLLSALTVMVVGSIVAFGTFSAFSSSTENPGNNFDAGTVAISDNDAGSALYNVTNRKPGQITEKCIKVTYNGTLASDVKLYNPDAVNANVADYTDLAITSGTGSASGCSDFAADASGSSVYSGELDDFQSAYNSYANGLVDNPLAQIKWDANDTVTYKFRVELQDNNAANSGTGTGYASGTHKYVWEARNQ